MKEKRKSNESSDSEDDIWEYKSVKRVRKKPGGDEVSNSFNIAQSKVTVDSKRRTRRSLTQVPAKDSNTEAFKTTSKNKRNKATGKPGASGDGANGKDVKTKSSQRRQSVASLPSSSSQQLQQTLHDHNNKNATSASTSNQSGKLSQRTSSSQTGSRGGKVGTGRRSSTKKKHSQQTPQSKIPEVKRRF